MVYEYYTYYNNSFNTKDTTCTMNCVLPSVLPKDSENISLTVFLVKLKYNFIACTDFLIQFQANKGSVTTFRFISGSRSKICDTIKFRKLWQGCNHFFVILLLLRLQSLSIFFLRFFFCFSLFFSSYLFCSFGE